MKLFLIIPGIISFVSSNKINLGKVIKLLSKVNLFNHLVFNCQESSILINFMKADVVVSFLLQDSI